MEILDESNHEEKARVMVVQKKLQSLDDIAEKSMNIRCVVTSCGKKMGDMGYSYAEAQITTQHAASGNLEGTNHGAVSQKP